MILLRVQEIWLKCLTVNFFLLLQTKKMKDMPDKGQPPHRAMLKTNISLTGVIGCMKRLNSRKVCGPDKCLFRFYKRLPNK